MKPILIIAAMQMETAMLESVLKNSARIQSRGFEYLEGKFGGLSIVVCAAGVGKINAAAASAALIEMHQPMLVINTGCAGAYIGCGLSIGDLAVATEELLADEGVMLTSGWKDLNYMEMPALDHGGKQYFNTMPLCAEVSEKAIQLAEHLGIFMLSGRFATVSTCSGTKQRGAELVGLFNVIAENMEGAAVAQICLRYGVDCLEIRGISNMVEERNIGKWELSAAVEGAQSFVLKYLEMMDRPLNALRK